MENPIKMDDLGVPLFSEASISDSFQREKVGSLERVPDSQFVPEIFPQKP